MTESDLLKEVLTELRSIRALLAQGVVAPSAKNDPTCDVLTEAEAILLVKKSTPKQLKNWRLRFGVPSLGAKRFSRRDITLGLKREAGDLPMPRTLKQGGKYTSPKRQGRRF